MPMMRPCGLLDGAFDPEIDEDPSARGSGYASTDGSGSVACLIPLDEPGLIRGPAAAGSVRSFRYRVESFDPPGSFPSDPIFDSPVFESIWISLARKGRAPSWSAWALR